MKPIEINSKAFVTSQNEKKYIVLASNEVLENIEKKKDIIRKINKETTDPIDGFWGTIGLSDDEKINWTGHIEISNKFNDKPVGVVQEEIELIKECFPNLKLETDAIKERFVSFEHVDFEFPESFTLEEIPSIRLDIMLQQNEGAVVFYQSDRNSKNKKTAIEYILPQATDGNYTNVRDRLTYLFDIVPQKEVEEITGTPGFYKLGTTKKPKSFIVKVITFKRNSEDHSFQNSFIRETSSHIIEKVHQELAKQDQNNLIKIVKDHRLLVFDANANDFTDATTTNIDPAKKTLFLMHGTFGSTEGSFGKLYGKNSTWLKSLLKRDNPKGFEQILGFDHPTVFYGAEGNIAVLLNRLNELNIKPFVHEVDFIGTSQGGLLVQYLANLANCEQIKVGKAALIASANGVQYFTIGKYVAKFLTVLKYIFKTTHMQAQAIIASLAQHSAEFFLKQPGCQVMTPGNPALLNIMNTPPARKDTLYLPIVDDYDEQIIDDKDWKKLVKIFAKMGARTVDAITRKILGEENDWVVGTRNQYIVPANFCAIPGYNPAKFRDEMIPAIHGSCINHKDAQAKLIKFFFETDELKTIQEAESEDFFDAHCHLFGREIISGRILLLLIQDFLNYKKLKDRSDKLPEIPDITKYATTETTGETGSVAKNIIKYFALNKTSYQMINNLEDEYYKLKSNVYRYIPLMFDLEMTFRNKYYDHNIDTQISITESEFKAKLKAFKEDIDKLIDRFEKNNEIIYYGSLVENEESVKMLKIIKACIQLLKVSNLNLRKETVNGYTKQLDELIGLKVRYGNNIFPFLAVDPRRDGMGKIIEENVGKGKTFHGIKLYAPNGYSPTDPNLFDDKQKFVNGKSLYSFCIENDIPVMAHCSNAGFSTFTMDLEVWGDICLYDSEAKKPELVHYEQPTKIIFDSSIIDGGFAEAVRERAHVLNHPEIWRKVLEKYSGLKICLAHFGGESPAWRTKIAELMNKYSNVYTDLSCMVDKNLLKEIKTEYFDTQDPVIKKIMYGSDFFLNMLNKIEFSDYYKHFVEPGVFSDQQMKNMAHDIPKKFLGIY